MASNNNNNRTRAGGQLRDSDELKGPLLPTASLVGYIAPLDQDLPTARPVASSRQQAVQEAPMVPPVPTDEHYKNGGDDALARAELMGRMASESERLQVMRNNRKVPAYNNQAELDVDRANEAARIENYRERRLVNPPIATPPVEPSATSQKKKEEGGSYFSSSSKGGYEVKDYDMGNYDDSYSYDIAPYKSDYD